MALRQYSPSGKFEPNAVMVGIAGTAVAGVAAGLAEAFVAQWFSLFIIFPLLLGVAVGLMGTQVIKKQKLRAPLVALLIGLLSGTLAYATTHVFSYVTFRREIAQRIRDSTPDATDEQVKAALEEGIEQVSGQRGFAGFMVLAARNGVTITNHGKDSTFKDTGAWVIWALEWLGAALCAAFFMFSSAKEPFCESCEEWYSAEQAFAGGGDGKKKEAKAQFLAAIEAGDFPGAAQAWAGEPNPKNLFTLSTRVCPRCGMDVHFTLKQVVVAGNKTNVSNLASWLATPDQATRLQQALQPPAAPAAASDAAPESAGRTG